MAAYTGDVISLTIYGAILGAFGVCITAYLICIEAFNYYIKREHRNVWLALGSPSFLNNSIANNWLLLKFFAGASYRTLSDPKVERFVQAVRVLFLVNSAFFLVLAALFPFLAR